MEKIKRKSLQEKMIEFLSDRQPHKAYELPAISLNYTSTICMLRKQGYDIDCQTQVIDGQKQSIYRLISCPGETAQRSLFL